MEADFCVEALREAMARYGRPEIFNTDQGSQLTSLEFTETLREVGVQISMDGRGRWIDNVRACPRTGGGLAPSLIERLWRSLKHECVYLQAFETGSEARRGIGAWVGYYNRERPHSGIGGLTPNEAYGTDWRDEKLAA